MAERSRPFDQLSRKHALVVSRPALVGVGVALGRGCLCGQLECLVVGDATADCVLGLRGDRVRSSDCGQPDARLADGVAVQPDHCAGGRDRVVAGSPLDLGVGAAGSGSDRDLDLGDDFGRACDCFEGPGLELPYGHNALATGAADHDICA